MGKLLNYQMNNFDVCIIGGGPGGYTAAIEAERKGLRVLLVEKKSLGGTCLNLGCIPTKSLLKSAELYSDILKNQNKLFNISNLSINFDEIIKNSQKNIRRLLSGLEYLINNKKITYINGNAKFKDKKTIKVLYNKKEEIYNSDIFIISTGSIPKNPKNIMPDNNIIYDSDGILQLSNLPKSILIVGGGYIGIEFAFFFNSLGSEVTIVEDQKSILSVMDTEIINELKKNFKGKGIKIEENSKVSINKKNENHIDVNINNSKFFYEKILVATGRQPLTEGLDIESLDIKLNNKNFIITDSNYKTNIENIFAIGDVTEGPMLAHRASFDGFRIIDNIYGDKINTKISVPSCVYCQPEIATIGSTEDSLLENQINFKKAITPFKSNGKSIAQGENRGFCKIMVDKEFKILGAHIIGKGATEMISELNILMSNDLSIESIINTVYPHPTLSEIIYECCLQLIGRERHI